MSDTSHPYTDEQRRAMQHSRNCAATTPGHEQDCTCGLRWREQIERLEHRVRELRYLLRAATLVADIAQREWDEAPEGMRAGKLLIALAGGLQGYRQDTDAIHAALDGEPVDIPARLTRLAQWVNDLQSGMYVNCVYCGHRYGPKSTTPVTMADALKAHVEKCTEHPMSALKRENGQLREALLRLSYVDQLFPKDHERHADVKAAAEFGRKTLDGLAA